MPITMADFFTGGSGVLKLSQKGGGRPPKTKRGRKAQSSKTPNDAVVVVPTKKPKIDEHTAHSPVVLLHSQETESPEVPIKTGSKTYAQVVSGPIWGEQVLVLSSQEKSGSSTDDNTKGPHMEVDAVAFADVCEASTVSEQSSAAPRQPPTDKPSNDYILFEKGTINQRHFVGEFEPALQCLVMASTAVAYACVKKNICPENFSISTPEIDEILKNANETYLDFLGDRPPRLLYAEELPRNLKAVNYKITVTEPNWIVNGRYPDNCDFDLNRSVQELYNILCRDILGERFNTPNDGFLFTGNNYTTSFWKAHGNNSTAPVNPNNCEFYLFNSHNIDEHNVLCQQEGQNSAKIFKVTGAYSLASLLLKNPRFNDEYSIHHIKLLSYNWDIIGTLTLNVDNVVHIDTDLTKSAPKKPGRPKKVKRGQQKPNKTDTCIDESLSDDSSLMNTSIDMFIHNTTDNVNLSDTSLIENIEIEDALSVTAIKRGRPKKQTRGQKNKKANAHLDASSKYNKNNPEVHQEAVRRYTESNPEVNRDAVIRYQNNNPERRESHTRYNSVNRHVIPALRAGALLIGERSDEELTSIPLFTLKKTCLTSEHVYICGHCGAKLFEEEKNRLQWCCGQGKNNILALPALDGQLYSKRSLVTNSRSYNNLFAFSAIGVSHGFQYPAQGIGFVKVQGRVYHRVFDLSHRHDMGPNPIGLYIEDNMERERLAEERGLDQNIVREMNDYLHRVNPFITCFKRLSEETSDEAHLIFENTTRRSHGNILGDMPRGNEVAAIINTEREPYQPRSICIWKIGQSRPHTVDIFHPLYETLQYPLLYPHGGAGWTVNTQENSVSTNAPGKLSQVKYYRCLLLSENRFWQIGRLSDEWIVDMYCRTEEERLRFIANMQTRNSNNELRSAPLEEVRNAQLAIAGDETVQGEGGVVPGRVYLPNTFTGSPRYMKCKYMDAIAIVNRLGRPSYFLTITCNPKWPEIQENTPQYCTPPAALCARVFQLKLNELLKDLRSGCWFGKLVYIFYVIEFQKRGLPHAHICFKVEHDLATSNLEIDKFIRGSIPQESEAGGRLRAIVLKHMIHGPCGPNHRTDLPCWDAEKLRCNKRFPKPATEVTHIDDRGFVHLKRNELNTGTIRYRSHEITVNDRWVVPYNAALLLKYDCHINLDVAATRKVIKYLFKYMTKGPDEASVAIVPDEHRNDEIEQYVVKRYIGACDAAWRMFEFDTTAREPTVKQLAVHLEGQQSIFFKPGTETDAVERSSSDLIKYFNRPSGAEFDVLTYQDFYENYIIYSKKPNSKNVPVYPICNGKFFVKKRERGEMVARLFWVTPNRGEQFYLRMLLSVRPCRSYSDLIALGGPNCTTFQEAARTIGIANDEREYELCLQEAAAFYTGRRLRHFFVLLITNGAPALILWEQFKQALSEDILERLSNQDPQRAYDTALIEIGRLLRKYGSRLQDHGLPIVEDSTTELSRERSEHDSNQLSQFVEHWVPLLSQGQKQVFDYVCTLLNSNDSSDSHKALFLDGPAGTGKTLLLNLLVAYVRGVLKGVAICTASSGIAAQNYEGGCTAHSMFRLPLDFVDDQGYWGLTNGSQRAELIRASSLIIYDEAPMAHKYLIHILDRSLQDLMGSSLLFGGKLIILAGDFRQIPPVVTTARCPNDVFVASLRSSPIWDSLKKFSLTEAQRTREDEGYSEFLLNLGSGVCENLTLGTGRNQVTLISLRDISFVTELTDLISFVFPDDILQDPDTCAKRAILTTHNINMRQINHLILEKMQGEVIHCYSVDSVDPEHADDFHLSVDTLHRVEAKGVPDHDLKIKKGCVCIIIRNLSFVDRLVNGTKVIVEDVSPRLITVRKPNESETYLIPRITFKCPIEPGSPIEMNRRQFPISLCFSISFHKSQGQTLESRVGVDLRADCFSHGQLYVGLGRVRNKENIKVLVRRERVMNGVPLANNVIIRNLIE